MIALRVLAFLPFWLTVFVLSGIVLVFQSESDAEALVDAAQTFWQEWR